MSQEQTKTKESDENKRLSTGGRPLKYADNILPLVRIKKIMKMDQNISGTNISVEANYLICAATEHFIRWLSKETYDTDKKALSYTSLSAFIQSEEKLDFLHQIVPNRITVQDYKKILEEEKSKVYNSDSDIESSSTGSEEEESGEEEEDADGEESEEEEEEEIETPKK